MFRSSAIEVRAFIAHILGNIQCQSVLFEKLVLHIAIAIAILDSQPQRLPLGQGPETRDRTFLIVQ